MGTPSVTALSAFSQIYYASGSGFANSILGAFAYRPPQWVKSQPALVMTVADQTSGTITAYVFDGTERAEHEQRAVITQNPIQTGASLSDHMYTLPPVVTANILMSDCMQSFIAGQFASGPSRSVSAYQTLVDLQQNRKPVSISTRLKQYDNMMISSIITEETKDTLYGLRATVTFQKILTASIEIVSSTVNFNVNPLTSEFPQQTGATIGGQAQSTQVPTGIFNQNNVSGLLATTLASVPKVPGAGVWTSTGSGVLTQMVSGLGH